MDIIITSLEALIQRATNNQNQCPDTAAIDAFCGLINQEPECAQSAARFISAKAHSMQEWEALQALNVLDTCMKRCGSSFHAEVGKFRFLNELIKLVSPKYLGAHTPEPVRRRVLELIQSWTVQYPKEVKIKEAYDMLKKQGVVKEERIGTINIEKPVEPCVSSRPQSDSIFQDEEKSRLLQKLLQSKKPGDLQAANKLIKTMVKEDEKRVEQKVRRLSELEAVHNNVRLLSEMLDCYRPGQSSSQDLELITELHTSCKRLRPTVFKLASEVHAEEDLFGEVFAANDELGEVFDKYNRLIVQGKPIETEEPSSLLDLGSPSPSQEAAPSSNMLLDEELTGLGMKLGAPAAVVPPTGQDLDSLGDIFGAAPNTPQHNPLQPIATGACLPMYRDALGMNSNLACDLLEDKSSKIKALEDLDKLGAELLRESLPDSVKSSQFTKSSSKVPMNQLHRLPEIQSTSPTHHPTHAQEPDVKCLDLLMDEPDHEPLDFASMNGTSGVTEPDLSMPAFAALSIHPEESTAPASAVEVDLKPTETVRKECHTVKPLGDLTVALETIKPGNLPPRTLFEDGSGMTVVLHLSQSHPRPDVAVFVMTATSRHSSAISSYLFQPVVPKTCRLKLQPPTATSLPPHNPFLPPAVISQVMLIASVSYEPIKLKYVVSYSLDEETITEMGELDDVPLVDS